MAAKNRLEAYQEEKAAKQTAGQQDGEQKSQTKKNRWEEYKETHGINSEYIYAVANSIADRVNTYLANHNNYLTNYKNRFSGRKNSYEDSYVSDSSAWLDTITKQKSNFDAEYHSILDYMDQYSDYLDADWVKNVRHTLNSAWNQQNSIINSSKKDNEYWMSFTPNEEQITAGYDTAAKVYGAWQAERKQYDYDLGFDVNAGMLELEGLKKEREAYWAEEEAKRKEAQENESFWDKMGRWMGTTPDTTIPLAGASNTSSNGSRTKYDSQISALEEQIERSKYLQGYEGFMDNMDAKDYAAGSQYRSTRTGVAMEDAMWGFGNTMYDNGMLFGDFYHDYINRNQDALDVATVNGVQLDEYILGLDKNFLHTMTEDELGVYNYLYNTQGKEAAKEFLSFITSELTYRQRRLEEAEWAAMAKEDPFGMSVVSVMRAPLKGLSYLGQVTDFIDDGKIDQNAAYNRHAYTNTAIRNQVSTMIEQSGKWGGVGSFAYNTGMSMADFLYTTGISGGNQALSLAIMGTGAAADTTIAAKDRGLDDAEAFTLGTIAGIAEVAMERISLGAWLDGDMSEGALRYVLKNALSEGGEEVGTTAINLFADVIIAADKSELNMAVQEYMKQGKSESEAFGLALADQAAQMGMDFLGGFLSGSAIGGGTYTGSKVGAHFKYGDIAKNSQASRNLVSKGLKLDPDNKYIQKMQGKLDKGKNLTGMQVRNVLAANQEQITANDMKLIRVAAEKRLTELGQTEDVSRLAELATKWATGGKLTLAEKRLLTSSKYGSRVANELLPSNIASGEYATDWAEEIGTEQVNKAAYNKKTLDMVKAAVEEMKALGTYQSLEKRVGEETPAQVSATGKAVIRGTDEEIDLTAPKVKSISEDSVVLDVNGRDVDIDEIDFADEDQWNMFNALKKIEHITPAVASSMIANLDMTKPIWGQLNGMDEAFTYGYHNYSEADLKAGNFTGNLTKDQLNDAYNLGKYVAKNTTASKTDTYKRMRTAADVAAEKAAQKDGKGKKLTITYNHGNGVIEDIDAAIENMELNDEQRAGIEVAKLLHQMGIGTSFEFFTSYFSENQKDKDGNPLEVFTNEMGEEEAAYAGLYLAADGKIRINLKAYSGTAGLALNAMSHELVHFIKDWSLEKYNTLASFLAKAYGESGLTMNQRVLREQARLKKIRGKEVGYDEAHEEVVANALNRMLEDGKVLEKLAELKKQDRGLFRKLMEGIKKFINKFMSVYQKNDSLYWDTVDLMEMKEAFEQLQNLFAEALADASENFQASLSAQEAAAVESLGENAKVETNADGQLLLASNESGNVQMYSEQTWQNGGRTKLEAALRQNGHTAEEIKEALSYVDDALDYIKILAAGYAKNMGYNALSDHLVADIVTNVKTGKQVMSAIVNNGDYPVNIDLALICKKRVAYMNLMTRLIQDGIFDKVNYDGAAIAEVNEILRDNGFETACLGCFVESRRLQFQTWAETIVSEWNAEVEKRNPNAKEFGFAKGKMENLTDADIDALTKELESVKKNDQGNVNLGQGNSVTRMGRLLDALPSLQKKLTVEDLLTPEGLTALRKHDGSLFSIVKSRYGAASPKIVQDFNPYASEIAMLTFANVKSITNNAVKGAQAYVNEAKSEYGKLKKNKGESKEDFKQRKAEHEQRIQDEAMRRYLYDIGGARIQSFSDFMIENVFDYIQIFADLAAKRLPLHGYTKEIVCMRLFGMTGAKWNGSLIAHVERSMGKELAGLLPAGTKDGIPVTVNGKEYVIGFDDVARNLATNGKSFIQSIGMKDVIALQLDPRYSPYVGNITIGVSDAQILAMLDNPLFRMVIPYHASGMLPMFAKLVGVDMYNDYTDYQNTTVRQYYDLDGNAVTELKNAKGETVKADTSYAFNAEIQKTKDARVAADNYLKWCAERHPVYDGSNLVGYATFNPKFSSSPYGTDFTRHKNYYKLLEDFNTYDCITEASTVQGAVTMNFPSEENRLTKQQMEEYKNALRETGIFTEADIEKYAKKADMTFKEIIKAEVGNRANYAATQAPKWESTVKAVEAKLQKDHAREMRSSQQTDLHISPVEQKLKDAAQADIDKAFAAAVDTEINNPTLSRKSLLIGYTPDILLKLGVPSLPMTFNNDHIYSCAKTKQEAIAEGLYDRRRNYHGLGASGVKKIYEALKDPVAVIVSKNPQTPSTPLRSTHSVVILVEIQGNINSLLLPVKITVQSRLGRLDVEVNEVSSAYDTDAAKYMRDAIWSEKTEGVGVFYITEKAKTLVNGGLQLPTKLQQALASSDGIVHQIPEKINMAVSTNTQSIQFTNWFGDWQNPQLSKKKVSVVVNADGTPKVVFHGTSAVFSEFAKGDIGYHVGSRGQAEDRVKGVENGHVLSLYAVIRNPLYAAFDFGDWHGNYVAGMLIETEQFDGHPAQKTIEKRLAKIAVMDDVKASDDALRNYLEGLGYDGIIYENQFEGNRSEESYIVFRANQLKSASINVGSYDGKKNDFRYSSQQTDNITNRHLLANAFEGISKSSIEYKMIQEYKGMIDTLNRLDNDLANINAEIRKIRFTKGERDMEALHKLEEKAKRIAKDINRYDKRLLNMEASEPLRKVIEQERKKEALKTIDHVKEIVQNKKLRAEQTELRHKIRKAVRDLDKILNRGNKKQNVKEDMKGFVSKALELADYLFTDHISNDELIRRGITVRMTPKEAALVKETEDILSKLYDNADNLTDEEFTKLDAKRKANEEKLRDLLTAQRNERLNTPVYNLFNDLVTEYASLKNSKQDAVKAAYDPNVERFLRSYIGETNGETDSDRKTLLQNMRVADMTTDELWKLHNAYKMVLHSVRDANKLWVKGKTETIEQMAGRIMGDFSKRKTPNGKVATVLRNLSNKMGWDYEKLHYALDRIGSEAFTELVMNIANSENTVMQDVIEAALFRDQMVEKYGFNNWAVNKEIDKEFLDNTGKKFKLTLGQMMALYAYSRREGAWDHIEYGGFVFGEAALTNPKPADSYKLSKAQCEAITGLLTAEQKGYVEEMQKFLSETMGEKGNEVSMMLYGIKMFEEKNYFPIHIAGQFKAQAQESQAKAAAGFGSMSNAGFTHAQNPNAKAPFVLEGFNEIWVDHVNEMSRYHGTVPALEDMRRVMNRSSYSESGADSMAIKQLMENSYGKEAVAYFDNLYREANSGAITDKLQQKAKKWLSLFRKNSVAYSLSVIVQQPTAMIRAYAMIDKKYFGFKGFGTITSGIAKAVTSKWNPAYANAYNEMLKYAPGVTMAKEIGGFDTATGGSIRSYLLDTNKSTKQKWKTGTIAEKGKAVLDIVDDNAIANLPTVADKIAWIEIWNACKRETVAKHKDLTPNSEEFMKTVGDRFTEVIRATQVYDSIFSKSPMLKSKNLAVQYLVSFMNEPNTVANMVEKAVRDVSNGNVKAGARTAVYVVYSVIFNNLLKSMIYALRDDDEDEAYTEKYIEAVVGNLMNDFFPLTYIPVARDVWSIAQGYDVERADMAIIADALDALNRVINNAFTDTDDMTEEQLVEFDKKVTEANWSLVESAASFFGIPVKNIRREVNAFIDHARIASANAGKTTGHSAKEKAIDAIIESIPFMSTDSKQDKLYEAIISGDTDYVNRLKAGYKDEDAYNSAVRKTLRENDPRIHEAAQAYYNGNIAEYKRIFKEIRNDDKHNIIGFDNTMEAVMSEVSAIRGELEPKTENSAYNATDFVNAIMVGSTDLAQTMKDDIISYKVENGESRKEAEKAFNQSVATSTRNAYDSGLLDEAGTEKMLTQYAGMDEEEAAEKTSYWAFIKAHPQYRGKLSESNVGDYHEFAEPAQIPLDVFVQYLEGTSGLATIYDEWGDEVKSKREQVLEVIDSLPLTWQQKDALYLAAGYAESKIWDVPW